MAGRTGAGGSDAHAAEDRGFDRPTRLPPTFVARPGAHDGFFQRVGSLARLESADALELRATLAPGASARFQLLRAAVIV